MINNPNYNVIQGPYKSKYICTDCRKSFKRKMLADISTSEDIKEKEPKCPDCGNPSIWIGPKFRAPKTDNIKAWNSIKTLNDIGVLNFIGWANVNIKIPETKKSLNDLLKNLKASYERNIESFMTMEYSPDNKNQIKHFADAIKKIDKHLLLK
jgi:DNA-directed RNA polymerase subunit RPC12/RpoP